MRRILLALAVALAAILPAAAQDSGLLTRPSRHDFATTLTRLEASIREEGMRLFARLDHAEGAREVGLAMPPSTVVVFGNPRAGTPNFLRQPTLAIDLPLRALVWQDQAGTVSITWNTAQYLMGSLFPRHGITPGEATIAALEGVITRVVARALE